MHSFLIGLQFLTRIRLVNQTEWTAEDFGRSTRFFPLVGLVLGICYASAAWLLVYTKGLFGMQALPTALLLILPLVLTGGLHADGFMDTADGVFSGRERERKLEIMKDSRVGSFGVVSFVLLMFVTTTALVLPWGTLAAAALVLGTAFALLFCSAMTKILGGVTGDVYGAATVLTETLVLAVFSLASTHPNVWGILWK